MSRFGFNENLLCLHLVLLLLLLLVVAALTNILYLIVNLTLIKSFVQRITNRKKYKCAYIHTHTRTQTRSYTRSVFMLWTFIIFGAATAKCTTTWYWWCCCCCLSRWKMEAKIVTDPELILRCNHFISRNKLSTTKSILKLLQHLFKGLAFM